MKKLIISLDDDIQFTHLSYNSTYKAIQDNLEYIVTPCLVFFSTVYTCQRYEYQVYARNKKAEICLNDLMSKKEVRMAQSAFGMLLSGCFYPVAPEESEELTEII